MDEFDWLDDLPDAWSVPPELQGPTRVHFVNFVICVISSDYASNSINEAIGELLAEHGRFNVSYQLSAKERLPDKDLMGLSAALEGVLKKCWEAWLKYQQIWTSGSAPSGGDYQQLLTDLRASRDEIRRIRPV
ncbi:hypothetical protein [Streptomyces sp. WAC06614]|uniref:hypothetical protein n=1 Tax=Streptomyces sp. WAC06614 TaxID=2487416 RepID=UPI000F7B36F4|nr:hypothetical protein [Streptomyces sp. WAC06614]RSS83969.1 hypothetical protein EF918_01965 [Streptomyces sp. WAC06614]